MEAGKKGGGEGGATGGERLIGGAKALPSYQSATMAARKEGIAVIAEENRDCWLNPKPLVEESPPSTP